MVVVSQSLYLAMSDPGLDEGGMGGDETARWSSLVWTRVILDRGFHPGACSLDDSFLLC